MSEDPVEKVVNAEAWTEFCDLLKKAGDVILRDDLETSAFDRGEGLRYLGRLLRAQARHVDLPLVVLDPRARQLACHVEGIWGRLRGHRRLLGSRRGARPRPAHTGSSRRHAHRAAAWRVPGVRSAGAQAFSDSSSAKM